MTGRCLRWLYRIKLRLRSLFLRSLVEDDLADEIRDHRERHTEALIAKGMSPVSARLEARRAMAGIEQRKEDLTSVLRLRTNDECLTT